MRIGGTTSPVGGSAEAYKLDYCDSSSKSCSRSLPQVEPTERCPTDSIAGRSGFSPQAVCWSLTFLS